MLSKKHKLNSLEIKDLFNKRERSFFSFKNIRSNFFDVKIFLNNSIKENKYSTILSGKIFKKAIERNKIKRQIYTIFEGFEKKTNKNKAFILIYPKKEILNIKFQDLEKELYNVLDKNL